MPGLSDLTMQPQGDHTEWCWACVTASVFQFFDGKSYTPQEIVSQSLKNPTCADDSTPDACNCPWPIEWALDHHFSPPSQGQLTFDDLQQQTENLQRPVVIMVTYQAAAGSADVDINHYCLVKVCTVMNGVQEVTILDPLRPEPCEYQIPYPALCAGDVNGALWTQTFLTSP
jgi:hypothetical protein